MKSRTLRASVALAALAAVCCESREPEPELLLRLAERSGARVTGELLADGMSIEFASAPASPLTGVVSVEIPAVAEQAPLSYELRYDYGAGTITSDGHGARLTRSSVRVLLDAAERLSQQLGQDPGLPLHEQMLFAAFVLLGESGGMALTALTFELGSADADDLDEADAVETDKSLGNDGVSCIEQGATYLVSYDFDSTTVIDSPIVAGSRSCNGMCGPSCTQLTATQMWTLDCLEHDTCCSAVGDHATCWTPLGECGDEYVDAEADFLRGFDPLRRHCGG